MYTPICTRKKTGNWQTNLTGSESRIQRNRCKIRKFNITLTSQRHKESRERPIFRLSGFCTSLKLGVFFIVINCICLSFMQIHTDFYSNYIIYFALLIFCCQDVATPEPYTILSPVQSLTQN